MSTTIDLTTVAGTLPQLQLRDADTLGPSAPARIDLRDCGAGGFTIRITVAAAAALTLAYAANAVGAVPAHTLATAEIRTVEDSDAARFRGLASRWRQERPVTSSAARMAGHPAYLQIVAMRERALPFLLEELAERPDHWFLALQAITGEDPVAPEDRGRLDTMAAAWIEWGRRRGLVAAR